MKLRQRPRRNRRTPFIRDLLQETSLSSDDLIAPLFVISGEKIKEPIASMPGQFRYSIDELVSHVEELRSVNIKAVALFPVIDEKLKSSDAKEAYNKESIYIRAIRTIKTKFPELILISDVALDPYSSDGHDGLVKNGEILNDESVEILQKMALVQAQAGVDIVAPSDMMDGRVQAIREVLDENNFSNVSIMSYCAKYASAFYGPFRDALDSAPKAGDKKTYQMNVANKRVALRELALDEEEGADIVMVKPALSYLDVIAEFKANSHLPVAAYNVSGEYAMVHAAAERGWLDKDAAALEMLTSIKRAGADIILTYFAYDVAKLLKK